MPSISLTGLAPVVDVTQAALNQGPQLLDTEVGFSTSGFLFRPGTTLTVSGLLAEDRIGILPEGFGARQVGLLAGGLVTYGGVAIGSYAGGVGTPFKVDFYLTASDAAIRSVIQRLAFDDDSATPAAERTLKLDVSAGGLRSNLDMRFEPMAGDPLAGIDVGTRATPTAWGADGMLVGAADGALTPITYDFLLTPDGLLPQAWRSGGIGSIDAFPANAASAPTVERLRFTDDASGFFFVAIGFSDATSGSVWTVVDRMDGTLGGFPREIDPYRNVLVGSGATPAFVDLDGDGNNELVVGDVTGALRAYGFAGAVGDAATPLATDWFAGVSLPGYAAPAFMDIDFDGRPDLVAGSFTLSTQTATITAWRNTGSGFAAFATNPFAGITANAPLYPAFVDVDRDGLRDLVVGYTDGTLKTFRNASSYGADIKVTISNAPPVITLPDQVSFAEGRSGVVVTPRGSDPEGKPLAWSLGATPDADLFTIDGAIGAIRFRAPPDFEAPGDRADPATGEAAGDNLYRLEVLASDGVRTTAKTLRVAVTDVFDAGNAPAGPVILPALDEDSFGTITAADLLKGWTIPAGLTATVSNVTTPAGIVADLGGGTWVVRGAPDDDTAMRFAYAVTVGGRTQAGTALLDLLPVNDLPKGPSPRTLGSLPVEGATLIGEADLLAFWTDADGDPLRVTSLTASAGALSAAGDGLWHWAAGPGDRGTVTFTYLVSDGTGVATGTSELRLVPPNQAPGGMPALHLGEAAGVAALLADPATLADPDGLGAIAWHWQARDSAGTWQDLAGGADGVLPLADAPAGGTLRLLAAWTDGVGNEEAVAGAEIVRLGTAGVDRLRAPDGVSGVLLLGLEGDDVLKAGAGAQTLAGGPGADTTIGGPGDDVHVVDDPGDVTVERAGGGWDLVVSAIDWQLGPQLEALVLTGSDGRFGRGNGLANLITGTSGDDSLYGYVGDDTLRGGEGADRLEGGPGDDRMEGGGGDDTYLVDGTGDVVVELAGEGADTVLASIDYVLPAEVEALVLTGRAVNGTGNGGDNLLAGNGKANLLSGGDGADTLVGGGGRDTLVGGDGGDTFRFLSPADNPDLIADFGAPDLLQFWGPGFGGGLTQGMLPFDRLVIGTKANATGGQFLYDTAQGRLFWDVDGTGSAAPVLVAWLTADPTMLLGQISVFE